MMVRPCAAIVHSSQFFRAREAIRHEHKLCIGYRDEAHPINNFTVPRIALDQVMRFEGF